MVGSPDDPNVTHRRAHPAVRQLLNAFTEQAIVRKDALAEAGYNTHLIARWKTDSPKIDTLEALANLAGLTVRLVPLDAATRPALIRARKEDVTVVAPLHLRGLLSVLLTGESFSLDRLGAALTGEGDVGRRVQVYLSLIRSLLPDASLLKLEKRYRLDQPEAVREHLAQMLAARRRSQAALES